MHVSMDNIKNIMLCWLSTYLVYVKTKFTLPLSDINNTILGTCGWIYSYIFFLQKSKSHFREIWIDCEVKCKGYRLHPDITTTRPLNDLEKVEKNDFIVFDVSSIYLYWKRSKIRFWKAVLYVGGTN